MLTFAKKLALSIVVIIAATLFFPIVLVFAVFDAAKLCAWIGGDCLKNVWFGEWK